MFIDIFRRHPIIIPSNSEFTRLIFRHEHENLLPGSPQAVLSSVRSLYWPLNARSTIRKVIHECVLCFRQRPIMIQPIMIDLPRDRIEPARAFLKCGVDFAGPFMLKTGSRQNSLLIKRYTCIFVRFSNKAVYIELVNGLST